MPCGRERAALAALATALAAGPALCAAGPAEPPPAGFAGASFTDSRGCLFARAEVGGTRVWAPVLGPDGAPLCAVPEAAAAPPRPARGKPAAAAPAIPPDRDIIAIQTVGARAAGCAGPDRGVARITFRDGSRRLACDGLPDRPAALALRLGPAALGQPADPLPGPVAAIQIGAFADPGNAARAAARLAATGQPVATAPARIGDRGVTLVMAAPVDAALAPAVVADLRAAGFEGAYVLP